jgi:hypothetical protein
MSIIFRVFKEEKINALAYSTSHKMINILALLPFVYLAQMIVI